MRFYRAAVLFADVQRKIQYFAEIVQGAAAQGAQVWGGPSCVFRSSASPLAHADRTHPDTQADPQPHNPYFEKWHKGGRGGGSSFYASDHTLPRYAGRNAAAQLVFCGNCIESDGTRNGGMERGGKSRGGTEGRGAAFLPMVLQKGAAARRKKTAFFVRRTAAAARKKILLFLIYFKERSASPSCIFAVLRAACRMPSSFPFLAACRIQARCTFLCSSCRPCCTGEMPFNSFPTVPPCRTG